MTQEQHNQLVSFVWNIANDVLVNKYNKGRYRDIILPFIVIRRLDAVLETTKEEVLRLKEQLDKIGVLKQDEALCLAAKQAFCNSSPFTMKQLCSCTNRQQLKVDFIEYLNGYTPNVQQVLEKFKFRTLVDDLHNNGILGMLIEKFTDQRINLSNSPILDDDGVVKLSAVDNHSMGTIFEQLLRHFNEENNVTEAGEHFTPRDIVDLMADIAFIPVVDKITDKTYLIYDGACGTGGILTKAEERISHLAKNSGKKIVIHIYGQETQPETFATCKADLLIKGEGEEAENIAYGSTISEDGHSMMTFDFMISNPPFGTSWKPDLDKWGIEYVSGKYKDKINDSRLRFDYDGVNDYCVIPDIGDPQMLFLANNISKMKLDSELGSRIVEIHNGSSLFTGDAGGGESNLRRYIIENDMLEAIVAMPENMFYNTGIATFLWIVTNRKEQRRKGKVQLIDATRLKSPLRKNMGNKNGEFTPEIREQILDIYMAFEQSEYSKIFDNVEFGYWEVIVERPQRDENGNIVKDKKGKPKMNSKLKDKEQISLTYDGGIEAFLAKEVYPYTPDAVVDISKAVIGYELSFTKYFYKPIILRSLADIKADIKAIENETDGLLNLILGDSIIILS